METLDPVTRAHLDRGLENLVNEFRGVFSRETIDRYVSESLEQLPAARISAFVPCSCFASPANVCRRSHRPKGCSPKTSPQTFERIAKLAEADVLVFGHTHMPWIDERSGVLFVNCGSVGKPKDGDPRAAFAVLEPGADGKVEPRIERAEYDALAVARDMRSAGLPEELADKLIEAA